MVAHYLDPITIEFCATMTSANPTESAPMMQLSPTSTFSKNPTLTPAITLSADLTAVQNASMDDNHPISDFYVIVSMQ